jgi:hypothetical protein
LEAVEVWDDQHRLLGTFPSAIVMDVLLHHLRGALLAGAVRDALAALPAPEPLLADPPTRKPLLGMNGRRLRGVKPT